MLQVPPGDWSLEQLSLPASEPLTLNQAKAQLRLPLDLTDFDDLVSDLIASARGYLEDTYGIRLMKQRVKYLLAQFPRQDRIRFQIWPIQSVDSFTFTDVNGDTTALIEDTDYATRLWRKPSEVVLPWAKIWPAAILRTNDAIEIGLTVGFLTGASPELRPIPPQALQAMKLLIGHGFENGSAVTIGTLMKSDPLAMAVESMMANVKLYAA